MKRNWCLILFSVLSYSLSFSQTKVVTNVFFDNFNNNALGWSIVNYSESKPYSCFISNQNRYICQLPEKSPLGFTWANLPNDLKKINNYPNASISFDLQIVSIASDEDFSFGFIWDLRNTTNECEGGDFYSLMIRGDKTDIWAEINQRENCSFDDVANPIVEGDQSTDLEATNHIEIQKKNETYEVIINGVEVVAFEYQGDLDFTKLYFSTGTFAIDNFSIKAITYKANATGPAVPNTSKKPSIYVLLAGINTYDNENYKQNNLDFPVADAESMFEFWKSTRGGKIPSENIRILKNGDATTDRILAAASNLFSKANENDVIIAFFSGHGGNGIYCAYDGGLPYERLNQIIVNSKARNKLFIVDACRSGSWNVSNVLAPKGQRLNETDALQLFYNRLMNSGNGINFLLACKPNESSADSKEYGHGAFTHYLLEGLNGEADKEGDDDSIVTVNELNTFLTLKFREWNKKNEGQYYDNGTPIKQTPMLKGNGNPHMPVAVLPAN